MPNPVESLILGLWRHARGLAGAGGISNTGFVGWRSALGVPSFSSACLFFSDGLLRLWLQSVQYDLQHEFAWVTDQADRLVALTLLQVALSWEVWWLKTGSTGLAILQSARSCCRLLWERWLHPLHLLDHFCWKLLTPAHFTFFNGCTAASTSVRRIGWSSSVSVWGQFNTDEPPSEMGFRGSQVWGI